MKINNRIFSLKLLVALGFVLPATCYLLPANCLAAATIRAGTGGVPARSGVGAAPKTTTIHVAAPSSGSSAPLRVATVKATGNSGASSSSSGNSGGGVRQSTIYNYINKGLGNSGNGIASNSGGGGSGSGVDLSGYATNSRVDGEVNTINSRIDDLDDVKADKSDVYTTAEVDDIIDALNMTIASLETAAGTPGPQGEQGEQGPVGPAGPAGADGAPGANGLDGASAYEIALANGFTGTQPEWLDSLKGADGDANIPVCPLDADYAVVQDAATGSLSCVAIAK